jgi:hypothetical protein
MKRIVLLLALLLAASPSFAWQVLPCSAAALAKRAEFRSKPIPARFPLPKDDREVVTDFIGQYSAKFAQNKDDFGALARAMLGGKYRYEVTRVADWTPGRCGNLGNTGDTYFLVSVREPATGKEAARGAVFETGLFSTLALAPKNAPALTPLKAAIARDAQYVTAIGHIFCHPMNPCVASRNARGIFLQHDSDAYYLPIGGKILPWSAAEKLRNGQRYVSIGGDAYVAATPVSASSPPR